MVTALSPNVLTCPHKTSGLRSSFAWKQTWEGCGWAHQAGPECLSWAPEESVQPQQRKRLGSPNDLLPFSSPFWLLLHLRATLRALCRARCATSNTGKAVINKSRDGSPSFSWPVPASSPCPGLSALGQPTGLAAEELRVNFAVANSSHARPHHPLLPRTTAALQAIPKAPEHPLPQRKSFLLKQTRLFAHILGRLRKKSSCQSKPKEKVSKGSSSFASSHSEGGWRQIPAGSPAHRHPQSMISFRISPRPRLPATQKGILCAEDSSSRNIPR